MKMTVIRATLGILALAALAPASLVAQTPAPPAQATPVYQAAQLDQLLAPIALYPDELLGQILMASTYPLEVVEAQRWVQDPKNAGLKGDQLTAALQDKDWDPSVKSLAPFPQILVMMSDRLDWMQKLGDAFLAQQDDVMDAVQRLRQQAQAAGTLKSSPQQTVGTQDQTITIEPASPDNVYVPVYDPTVVYGTWPYPDYPPYYFEPPPDFVFGPPFWPGFWWGPVIQISFYRPFWGWDHCDWRRHRIHIDRDRFDRIEGKHRFPAGDTWQHDPYHRRGVAYRDPGTGAKFGRPVAGSPDARRIYRGFDGTRTTTQGIAPRTLIRPGRTTAPGTSVTAPGSTVPRSFVRPGTTTTPGSQSTFPSRLPTVQRPQGTIFGGYGRGADIRAQSERGHSSQQTISPRSFRPSVSVPRPSGAGRSSTGGFRRR